MTEIESLNVSHVLERSKQSTLDDLMSLQSLCQDILNECDRFDELYNNFKLFSKNLYGSDNTVSDMNKLKKRPLYNEGMEFIEMIKDYTVNTNKNELSYYFLGDKEMEMLEKLNEIRECRELYTFIDKVHLYKNHIKRHIIGKAVGVGNREEKFSALVEKVKKRAVVIFGLYKQISKHSSSVYKKLLEQLNGMLYYFDNASFWRDATLDMFYEHLSNDLRIEFVMHSRECDVDRNAITPADYVRYLTQYNCYHYFNTLKKDLLEGISDE